MNMTEKLDAFFVRQNNLTDGSITFDVMVRDAYGDEHLFWAAVNESAAEACADTLNINSNNWR